MYVYKWGAVDLVSTFGMIIGTGTLLAGTINFGAINFGDNIFGGAPLHRNYFTPQFIVSNVRYYQDQD